MAESTNEERKLYSEEEFSRVEDSDYQPENDETYPEQDSDTDVGSNEGMKKPGLGVWDDNWRNREDREKALNFAAATVGASQNSQYILNTANRFYEFLQGDHFPAVRYPYQEGEAIVIGPECFIGTSTNGTRVIMYKGEAFVPLPPRE